MKTKICCSCKKEKSLDKYYKHPHAKYGRQAQCKNCHKEINKLYHETYQLSKDQLDRLKEYRKNRYHTDINFKLKMLYRNRIYYALIDKVKSDKTKNLLGCSIEKLKQYLENQFEEGMSWDNYGEWHVDHIKPCASFDLTEPKQQRECFHYKNLQPLWAEDNFKKNAKF